MSRKPTDEPDRLKVATDYLTLHDPILAKVIKRAPLPNIKPHTDYYRELVESIISQQLSVKAAATILKRFKDLFASDFPSPADILAENIDALRAVGLSRQKASYIRDLAEKVEDSSIQFDHLDSLNNDEVTAELIQIKGVGLWTVHMFLMFCMGRLDVLPTGDLGIRNGVKTLYKLKDRPSTEEIEKIAKKYHWHPYESVASWYIWFSLDNKPMVDS